MSYHAAGRHPGPCPAETFLPTELSIVVPTHNEAGNVGEPGPSRTRMSRAAVRLSRMLTGLDVRDPMPAEVRLREAAWATA